MNASNQTEIIAPKCLRYVNEVAAYPNFKLLDKSKIACLLQRKKIRIDCIVFLSKSNKKQQQLEHEVLGIVFILNDKLIAYLSEFTSFCSIKDYKDKILLLDESNKSQAVLRRMINAYNIQAPSEIIAKFAVHSEDKEEICLQITAADFTEIIIEPKQISALANLTYKELLNFELEEYGFEVSWPAKDIQLNLESFKMINDKHLLKKKMRQIAKEKKDFGALMKKYRGNKNEFFQKDFGSISERQIRKYENGENYPSYESLQTISAVYGLTVDEYLEALAQMCCT